MSEKDDLKKAGLRTTTPRLKILDVFSKSEHRHLSAEEVYRHLIAEGQDIGLATVYRVLTQFETAGLLQKNMFGDNKSVFELDSGVHHDHMICTKCGQVEEFHNNDIERLQIELSHSKGFKLNYHEMNLYGFCTKCKDNQ